MVDGSEVLHVLGVGMDDKSYIACRDGDCTGCTLRLTFFGPKRTVLESGAPPSSKQLKRAVCGRLSRHRCSSSLHRTPSHMWLCVRSKRYCNLTLVCYRPRETAAAVTWGWRRRRPGKLCFPCLVARTISKLTAGGPDQRT